MENRDRILAAAARVYAEYGYRGATTRRIASAAGVNEVTLFRTFGSKAALLDEAVRSSAASDVAGCPGCPAPLPDVPLDPARELTAWAMGHMEWLRSRRALIRKTMGEFEERPAAVPCATEGWAGAGRELGAYLRRLGETGFVDWGALGGGARPGGGGRSRRVAHPGRGGRAAAAGLALLPRSEDAEAAGAMLMAAVFSDAMGRDMRPELYPQPAERAAVLYVRLFLRAVACRERPPEAEVARPRDRARAGGRTTTERTPS